MSCPALVTCGIDQCVALALLDGAAAEGHVPRELLHRQALPGQRGLVDLQQHTHSSSRGKTTVFNLESLAKSTLQACSSNHIKYKNLCLPRHP